MADSTMRLTFFSKKYVRNGQLLASLTENEVKTLNEEAEESFGFLEHISYYVGIDSNVRILSNSDRSKTIGVTFFFENFKKVGTVLLKLQRE